MIEGYIHSIESMGLVDGPGIRTVVFFQGCRLRCRYCHNPDTWTMRSGKEQIFTPEQLVNKILRFKPYFGNNGGVTFSGGEPLLQPEFLLEMLRLLKQEHIHTCLDTAGVGLGDYTEILRHTDLILYDVKHVTESGYLDMTGQPMDQTQAFLGEAQRLEGGKHLARGHAAGRKAERLAKGIAHRRRGHGYAFDVFVLQFFPQFRHPGLHFVNGVFRAVGQALAAVDARFDMGDLVCQAGFSDNRPGGTIFLTGVAADAFFRINLHEKHLVAICSLWRHIQLILNMLHSDTRHPNLLAVTGESHS